MFRAHSRHGQRNNNRLSHIDPSCLAVDMGAHYMASLRDGGLNVPLCSKMSITEIYAIVAISQSMRSYLFIDLLEQYDRMRSTKISR